jgi:flagellar biosynthesis/type III secretory pathway chaperone
MNTHWQRIAQCLRDELAEYGGLLRLFEAQQRSLFDREPDAVLRLAHEIETQARALGECRGRREQIVARFAAEHGCPANSTLRSMLPLVEADARPLLEALINEVNLLLHRVRRTSRHNHALLSRTLELHQETLLQLQPHAFSKTYSPAGRVSMTAGQPVPTLRAAG